MECQNKWGWVGIWVAALADYTRMTRIIAGCHKA